MSYDIEYAPLKTGGDFPFPIEDVRLPVRNCLRGNVLVKADHVKLELSPDHITEILRCQSDPIYFFSKYVRINALGKGFIPFEVFDYQKDIIRTFNENRFSVCSIHRQSGKTTVVAGILLHYAMFNYDKKTVAIVANKMAQAREIMDRIREMYEQLPFFLQVGVRGYNKSQITFSNNASIFCATSANGGLRGRSVDVLYLDEAAFLSNDLEFYESTYPVISSSNTTKIIMTSTPNGRRGLFFNIFDNAHEDIKQSKNGYVRVSATWKDDPRKDEAWKNKTLEEFGIARFEQEFNCAWRGSSGTLISPTILQDLQFINPIFEDKYTRIYKEYDPKKQYVAFVDTAEGLGKDYSIITVIEVSTIPHEVVCIYKNNLISPIVFPHTIVSVCNKYGSCPVLVETNNSSGGQVSYILYYELEYENTILTTANKLETNNASSGKVLPGVKTSRKVKSIGCSTLNTIIENNNLIINSEEILEELGTFILKGNSYEADKDCNDDLVMSLVIYSWYISQESFKDYSGNSLTEHIYNQSVQNAMQNILPFGVVMTKESSYEHHNNHIKVTTSGSMEDWLRE